MSESQLRGAPHSWGDQRIDRALKQLVQSGMVWIDDQADPERLYWFPSLFGDAVFEEGDAEAQKEEEKEGGGGGGEEESEREFIQ